MQTTVITHPIAGFLLTALRNKATDYVDFRHAIESLSAVLFVEATREYPTRTMEIDTPLEKTQGSEPEKHLVLIPVLRAGLAMVAPILDIFPNSVMYHIGAKRNEATLEIITYYCNIDSTIADKVVYILDPMLATGGTLSYAVSEVARHNPAEINMLTVIAAPEGLNRLAKHCDELMLQKPKLTIKLFTASIDRQLNSRGYILPGLGDAGDRAFGTFV